MKTAQVMRLLQISRPTVTHYREKGYIKATLLPDGQFNYDDDTIYQYLNKGVKRKVCLYARVSTPKQEKDLDNQVELLKAWACSNGIQISGIYTDIASGISFEKRQGFFEILDEVLKNRVEAVIISYKDRPSRSPSPSFRTCSSDLARRLSSSRKLATPSSTPRRSSRRS